MPSALTENEILSKHIQSLGEARAACQEIGRHVDPNYSNPRGRHYIALKGAIKELEGSARQMAMFRDDARWLKLGMFYGKLLRTIQARFVQERWNFFRELQKVFDEQGLRSMEELRDGKVQTQGPILPKRASEWLWMPDSKPVLRPKTPRN